MEIIEFLRKWLLINIFAKKSKVKKELIMALCMIMLLSKPMFAANCPASIPTSQYTIYHQDSFSTYSSTQMFKIVQGSVSSDLYYLYYLSTPTDMTVIRRVNTSYVQTWMAALLFIPIGKSLSLDSNEQNVYVISYQVGSLNVVRLSTSTGSIVSSQNQ